MKIYTKSGDKGRTSLVGGQRVSKCCCRLESYGTVDELNSYIGLLACYVGEHDKATLLSIQNTLFSVGAILATEGESVTRIDDIVIKQLEEEIDDIQDILPEIQSFILPGGTLVASYAHVCRTVCRRAERCILRLAEEGESIDSTLLSYMNRLSDYFFVLARKQNFAQGISDIPWAKN